MEKKFKVYAGKSDGTERAKFEMAYRLPDPGKSEVTKNLNLTGTNGTVGNNLEETIDTILLEKFVPHPLWLIKTLKYFSLKDLLVYFLNLHPERQALTC